MNKIIICLFLCVFFPAAAIAQPASQENQKSPETIDIPAVLENVKAAYLSLNALDIRGTQFLRTTETVPEGKLEATISTAFEMKLEKPNLFKIAWTKTLSDGKNEKGAVWSLGREAYVYIGSLKSYFKADTDTALYSAYGIKKGFSRHIPFIFFYGASVGDSLRDFNFEGSQPVGGDPCYVLSARSLAYEDVKLWVSKKEYLIRKAQYNFDKTRAQYYEKLFGGVIKEDQLIKSMGLDATKEGAAVLKKMMNYTKSSLSKFDSGQVTEIYVQTITNPDFRYEDLVYTVPDKTILQDSLYEYLLKNSEELLK